MKRLVVLAVILGVFATGNVVAQADGMLNLNEYSSIFINSDSGGIFGKYIRAARPEDSRRIASFNDNDILDTPLEIAILTTCDGVKDIRPAEANRMLGTPKQADLKLGAAVFMEMQILRFLNDTQAVSRHEAILKFITDRKNVTRAEIETFYKGGIAKLIGEEVDKAVVASHSTTLPNNIIPEYKRLLTDFYLSPNQTSYDAIINYEANYMTSRKLSDEKELQRIKQMNITGAGADLRRRNMEIDVEVATMRIEGIFLDSRINLGFRKR